MKTPRISWYAKMDYGDIFQPKSSIYAGTYLIGETIDINIQLWNNRYGETDVESLTNFNLLMYFKDFEDSSLLDSCSIYLDNTLLPMNIDNGKAVINFANSVSISGKANDGSSTNINNRENFISLTVSFTNDNQTLKEHDLKQLVLEIVPL